MKKGRGRSSIIQYWFIDNEWKCFKEKRRFYNMKKFLKIIFMKIMIKYYNSKKPRINNIYNKCLLHEDYINSIPESDINEKVKEMFEQFEFTTEKFMYYKYQMYALNDTFEQEFRKHAGDKRNFMVLNEKWYNEFLSPYFNNTYKGIVSEYVLSKSRYEIAETLNEFLKQF